MAFTKRVFLILSLLTTLSVFQVSAAPSQPMSNSEVNVNNTNNHSQITIQKDTILIVKLLANPGTGYSWQIIKNDSDKLKPLGYPVLEPFKTEAPGASENQVFRFLAQNPGSTGLELHYVRSWERNTPPAETYQIEVQIR